jgi:hypothetical protein
MTSASPSGSSAIITMVKKGEARAAAEILRRILGRAERGELTASRRMRARLEGAATAFEAIAKRKPK